MSPVGAASSGRLVPSPGCGSSRFLAALALRFPLALAPTPAVAATNYLEMSRSLMSRSQMSRSALLARPVSAAAWVNMREAARHPGTPDLCDQNNHHHLRTLAAAFVSARTGASAYGIKARSGVMAAIRTQRGGCTNATLALGRRLLVYVLAADFAGLSADGAATAAGQ